ncbi:MAG: cysteine--tRNA ligase [Patescibacteria group bacterium]
MKFLNFFSSRKHSNLPSLRFKNTLSGNLEEFSPLNTIVKLYSCGPTAYDEQHIGNLFPPVVANVLRRALEVWGYHTQEVNNITDFGHISEDEASEDKMTKGLQREGKALTLKNMRALAEKYAELFFADLPPLGINTKKVSYPRASDFIDEQIALIQTLEQKSFAYRTSDGVYFDVLKFEGYGRLGGIDLSSLKAGARVEENPEKRSPYDFALWKRDQKLGWKSPWGLGFPGWHTECVAMIFKLLGKQIDIHMGGSDLIPIHHNNEIAQAEAATGKQFVRYWIHNAHITVEGKKISKSIGNTIYLHNLVDRGIAPRSLRYWFLTGHYRTPMNFTWEAIDGANIALKRLSRIFYEELPKGGAPDQKFLEKFYATIADDLNTPQALALVWELVKDASVSPADKRASIAHADKILGLLEVRAQKEVTVLPEEVKRLATEREAARLGKNYAKADTLRKQIETLGFELTDTPEGPKITKK